MKKQLPFLFFCLIGFTIAGNTQTNVFSSPAKGWYRLQPGAQVPAGIFFPEFGNLLGISGAIEMSHMRTDIDRIGMKHYRFQQMYNKIPVEGAQFLLHEKGNKVISANGKIIRNLALPVTPSVSSVQAVQLAETYFGADEYLWKDPGAERMIKEISHDPNASFVPHPELMIVDPSYSEDASAYRLAWKMKLYSSIPVKGEAVYVDALTGEILHTLSLLHETQTQGTAVTKYSGTQSIVTDSVAPGQYVLRESSRGTGQGMETYDMKKKLAYGLAVDFTDADNVWNNVNAAKDEAATDAHWGAEMSYDYFLQKHGRSSFDDKGTKLVSYVHFSVNYVNAYWNGFWMTYGDGNGTYNILTALDICGHELTHGVTQHVSGLIYKNESGALNESFSDIFGTHIEFVAKPSSANWTMGDNIGTPFRNMANPKQYANPDCYKGSYWFIGTNDNGGVHTNSGVQNKWYYLLSVGGSGTNDKGSVYSVTGLGLDTAAQIAYRNLAYYLLPSSTYYDAREGAIFSAGDIYGLCSPQVYQTANAWYAVGVGDPVSDQDMITVQLTPVASACGLGNSEPVSLTFRYNGCDTVAAGDTVYVSYKLNSNVPVTDTVKLASAMNPGDSLLHNFAQGADLSVIGTHTFKGWVRFKGDTLQTNDTISNVTVEHKLAQNFDVRMAKLLSPVSSCSLGTAETVKLLGFFNGCDSMASGVKLPFSYRMNGGTVYRDTVTLAQSLMPSDSVVLSFTNKVNLSAKNVYKFDVWSDYTPDTINGNDTLKAVAVINPVLPDSNYITFEDSLNVIDSFYVEKGSEADVFVTLQAKKFGKFGLLMTGGNWYTNRSKYTRVNDLNTWTANPDFLAKACFCVDATNWTSLYMHFELKQLFNNVNSTALGYNYPYTSNLRITVNGTQASKTYNPVTKKTDAYVGNVLNLNAYAGQYINVCIETKNYQGIKYEPTNGDCAYLDNIKFDQDSNKTSMQVKNISAEVLSLATYPNPAMDRFTVVYNGAESEGLKIELVNAMGQVVYLKKESARSGANQFVVPVAKLAAGVYYLAIRNEGNQLVGKAIVSILH